MFDLDYEQVAEYLTEWITEKINNANKSGGIVGISGGIDSAVTAALLKRSTEIKALGLIMPCHSNKKDKEDAILVAETLNLEYDELDLSRHYDNLLKDFKTVIPGEDKLAESNIKPRLRMIALYYIAARKNYLVVGTDNWSELYTGYFTKYGDGGIDLAPLGRLVKTEVRGLARYLGVPDKIIEREPSAGLWEEQTDENEMGVSYETLDRYILGKDVGELYENRIEELRASAEHKLNMPPIPDRKDFK
ncbi:MAG: NAD(+) synthase [Halanaerobiaceae bacterium]